MNTLKTRALAVLFLAALAAPLLARQEKKPDSPASLVEQALYAEEHERDFKRALELYQRAFTAAQQAADASLVDRAQKGIDRAAARQRGAPLDEFQQNDPILCGIANCIDSLGTMPDGSEQLSRAYRDIALYGPTAVPWLEKAIAGPYTLCVFKLGGAVDRYVRALAGMQVPDADAALKRLLKSVDPLVRRAVAEYSNPNRQREVLMLALQDATPTVRKYAIGALARSGDRGLLELMKTYALEGTEEAASWLQLMEPTALLSVARDARATAEGREVAIRFLDGGTLPQTAEVADALLALAHDRTTAAIAPEPMKVLLKCVRDAWKPLDSEIASRVERALTADLDGYPQPTASLVLLAVGGGPAIESLAGRLNAIAAPLNPSTTEGRAFLAQLQNQLRGLTSSDFRHVAVAFRKIEPCGRVGDSSTAVYDSVLNALNSLAQANTPSLDIAAGAEGLEGEKLERYMTVAGTWIRSRSGAGFNNTRDALDRAWIPLLRRMAQSTQYETRQAAAVGIGDVGDPALLTELSSLSEDPNVRNDATNSISRIVRADPAKSRETLENAMTTYSASNGRLSPEIASKISLLTPTDALALAEKFWKQSTDIAVRGALYSAVCSRIQGPEGSEFLLRHFADARATGVTLDAIRRFGKELYEPAIDVLGESLKDPSPDVRKTAQDAFASFKTQRDALAEFRAWKTTSDEARTTIDELAKLLDSPNLDVVIGAVKSLGALKARAVYPKLVKMLERKEPDLKAAIQKALDQLGG
ncbi:MAG: HEAT repeat domain-containing protein [Planctomycetes bacterium]|nr:HEAT repeat domain-containing protein [Planctomycetota bacterium]